MPIQQRVKKIVLEGAVIIERNYRKLVVFKFIKRLV